MKRISYYISILLVLCLSLLSCKKEDKSSSKQDNIDDGSPICEQISHPQSVLAYDGGLLVANYGESELNPAESNGKGYISYYKNGKNKMFIPADGSLSTPRGMGIYDNHLFVCSYNCIMVYNLKNLKKKPQKLQFPEEDIFVSDLVINDGGTLFASVTNTGRVYILNISDPEDINLKTLLLYAEIQGAKGLYLDGSHLYVSSYNLNGEPTLENVIYVFDDVRNPSDIRHLTGTPGQYDGLALTAEGTHLFFTDRCEGGRVGCIRFEDSEVFYFPSVGLDAPADLNFMGTDLCVPDFQNSQVVRYKIQSKDEATEQSMN